MESKGCGIGAAQLVLLLFVSRFFTLMTYYPRAGQSAANMDALLTQPLSALLTLVLLLPFLWLCRSCGKDPLDCAFRVGKGYGVGAAVLFWLFCLQTAAYSASQFALFMTGTVYQNSVPSPFIVLLLAAGAYGAAMGLEAFSRMSALAFTLIVLAGLLFGILLLPEVKTVYLVSLLLDGTQGLWESIWRGVLGNAETVLWMLLYCRAKKANGKTLMQWLGLSTLAFEMTTLLLLTTLGGYAQIRLFPMHTAAVLAQFAAFGRSDMLHIIVWVLVAFLRVTLYVYAGAVCLRRIFGKLSLGGAAAICGVLAGGAALFAYANSYFEVWRDGLLSVGIPMVVLTVMFPLVTRVLLRARGSAS